MADDEVDPTDWLSSQFGGEPEPPRERRRRGVPDRPAADPEPPAPEHPTAPPVAPPTFAAPPVAPAVPPAASGGGFSWNLTPGGAEPEPLVEPPAAAPLLPPAVAPALPPVVPAAQPPEPAAWDVPTVATPVQPAAPELPPTVAFPPTELARQEFPGFTAPLDSSLDGATEVLGAQPVGLGTPEAEGPEVSALDSLFGDSRFVEYDDTLVPALPARGGELVAVRPTAPTERQGIPRLQLILMSVAGGLVAVLLLVVLFLAGTKIAANTPAAVPDTTPSATALPTVGPLPPGEYQWDQLLGGECLAQFESPWADRFTVVDCGQQHPAQLLVKGTFPALADETYPGGDELQKLVTQLCAVPTVVDYAAAGGANDIQLAGSFAADENDWNAGNRTYYCFATRAGGAQFTSSIAVPQAAATPTSTPAP